MIFTTGLIRHALYLIVTSQQILLGKIIKTQHHTQRDEKTALWRLNSNYNPSNSKQEV